jgi:PRTRC genetic system ThiF family protein
MNRKSDKQKMQALMRRTNGNAVAPVPAINLGYMNAAPVHVGEFTKVQIVIVGCGGIGAYMVMHVGRLMRVLYDSVKGVNLTLCDPDIVKPENLGRQLFCEAEVGEHKAMALARRYGGAWGLNCIVSTEEYSERLLLHEGSDLNIIIGCVDNTRARQTISHTLNRNPERVGPSSMPKYWWLDCGNLKDTGRVLLGSGPSAEHCRGVFIGKKHCVGLPSPALQTPDLLIPQRDETDYANMSCAQLQTANLQSLNINAAIAVQANDMLTRLLVTRNLKRYQCAVNMASGSVKSSYTTPEEVAGEIRRSPEFVMYKEGPTIDKAVITSHLRGLIGQEGVA